MTRTDSEQAEVLIVGGGLVGLGLAAALGSAGLACAVIDTEDPASAVDAAFDGRVSAIALATWRMLEATGVRRHLAEAQPILDIRVSDGDSLLFMHYDHDEIGADALGYMVENRVTRTALYARLAELETVRLIAPARVARVRREGAFAQAELDDGRTIGARLCVAADGRASPLGKAAGIRRVGWRYPQVGIVCTVHHERPHHGIAQEHFLPAGPFAILPMTGNRSSLVWTEREALASAIVSLGEADFTAEMTRRFGDYLGNLEVVGPRWSYPLALHLAERYVDHRLALVGDAAHGIHPISGQGLNLGLRDVAALAEVVVDAARLGLDVGDAPALARYQRWRRFDALVLAAVTDSLNRLFSNDIAPVRLARDLGLAALNRVGPLKRFFIRHAAGTIGDLPRLLEGRAL